MKYLAAYALCWLGGNKDPSLNDLKKAFDAIGAEFNEEEAQNTCQSLNGNSLDQIIDKGSQRLQQIGNSMATVAEGIKPSHEETTKNYIEQQQEIEDDIEGGMDLFGDDDDW